MYVMGRKNIEKIYIYIYIYIYIFAQRKWRMLVTRWQGLLPYAR